MFANIRILQSSLACSMQFLRGEPEACYPGAFTDFVRASRWIGAHTERDAVVTSRKPQTLYWYAHRSGDRYPFTRDADSVMRFLDGRHARYVVVDRMQSQTWRYLVPAIQGHLSRFRVIHAEGNPATYVFEYFGTGGSR